ncbi:hypothetical protein COO60DRAFT_497188 [Scenedesmus sp. NREL 46B-D3]|nr:hypothetical protein COO60DRAFT_497188 [Scenedesmus sp. NREL 46B-D3]
MWLAMTARRGRVHPRIYATTLAVAFCTIIGLRTCSGQVAALGCESGNVRYAGSMLPLLMGGVVESCKEGCEPRGDTWSKACDITNKLPGSPTVRKCLNVQTQAVLAQLRDDGNSNMLAFTPCELHTYLQGRTLWLIGDSLMQNFYYAMRCFMLDFWNHSLGECQASKDTRIERAIYHAADTNISSPLGSRVITDVPRCLWLKAGGRICWLHSVRGEEIADPDMQSPGLLQTLHRTVAEPQDIFYVNFGRWHFNNCQGLQAMPYAQALWSLGKLYEQTKDEFPNLIFKVSAHDHTACKEAMRNEQVDQCLPAPQGGYSLATGRRVMLNAENILGRFRVPIVNNYNETVKLHAGHITDRPIGGRELDCLHYCSPGVPEFDMWSMYKAFRAYGIQPLATAPGSRQSHMRARATTTQASGDADAAAAEIADLTVGLGSASSSSSSSSSGALTAGVRGSVEDLISQIGRRSRGVETPSPVGAPTSTQVPRDPHPRCVPVTVIKPPPGWSYYYDSLMRRGRKRDGQYRLGDEVAEEDDDENVLGTYTGDDEF